MTARGHSRVNFTNLAAVIVRDVDGQHATDSLGVERELGGLGVQRSVVPVEDDILEVAVGDLSLLLADAEDFGVVAGAGQVAAREAKDRGSIPLVVIRRFTRSPEC